MTEPRRRGRPGPAGAAGWPQVTVRLPPEVRDALATLAAETGATTTAYATAVLERHVATQTGPSVRARRSREARHERAMARLEERRRVEVGRGEQ